MAYTELTPVAVDLNGDIDPTYATATLTDGDMFRNTGREIIHLINASGGTIVVTIPTPATAGGGLTIEDKTYSLLTTEEIFIGQLDPALFNQPPSSADAGMVYIEYDDVTSLTVLILRN
jgi:hypothetical protein